MFHSSPEDALQAKESFYSMVPHQERIDLIESLV
jgi:hypothetical protein